MGWLIERLPLAHTEAVVVLGTALLGLAAGLLSPLVVLRQRSLVTDAVAHATLPGVCLAFLVTGQRDGVGLLVGAAASGAVAALALTAIERVGRTRPETAAAIVLSGSFSLGVVLLTTIAGRPSSSQAGLERYLFGQAAGMSVDDARLFAWVAVAIAACVALAFSGVRALLFDPGWSAAARVPVRLLEVGSTALLVTAAVVGLRAVGAVLLVALVVMPSVAARQLCRRLAVLVPLAAVVGAAIGAGGALGSVRAATPTGPTVVLVGAVVTLACLALAPGRGALRGARRAATVRATATAAP